jgi:hypothetical protein
MSKPNEKVFWANFWSLLEMNIVRNSGVGFDVDRLFSSGGRSSVGGAAQAMAVDSEGMILVLIAAIYI